MNQGSEGKNEIYRAYRNIVATDTSDATQTRKIQRRKKKRIFGKSWSIRP